MEKVDGWKNGRMKRRTARSFSKYIHRLVQNHLRIDLRLIVRINLNNFSNSKDERESHFLSICHDIYEEEFVFRIACLGIMNERQVQQR